MKHLAFLAAIGIATSLFAQSPPPPPTPAETSQEKQEAADREKDNNDLLKQLIAATEEHRKAVERQNRENSDKSSTDWWLVAFTGILMGVGIIQLVAMFRQAGYMREGLRETKRAADAANTSANAATQAVKNAWDALLTLERAVVKPETVTTIHQGKESPVVGDTTAVNFKVKNFGRTVAYSVTVRGVIKVGDAQDPLPEAPGLTIGSQGHIHWTSRSVSMWLNATSLALLEKDPTRLGYDIIITYRDVFEREHQCRASGRWNPALKRFDIISDSSD